ncbi:Hypothetical predicted protein [Pelobates cultripes]|uniref:Uncharacterized protein n=1 Tax=Pelobates cultripes TaxID=61616 RepID=A0AAD1TBT1_PELCU|nr:Hypothetical predicted protein [Pelobates cultripes]
MGGEGPITEMRMKSLLDSLNNSLMHQFREVVANITKDKAYLGKHISHIENKMADVMQDMENRLKSHEDKLTDLEDCSRRNNVRITGFAESIENKHLLQYVTLFTKLLPEVDPGLLIIDRIHRVGRLKHIPESSLRNVLMLIHYFHIKDQIMKACCKNRPPTGIQISANLC